MPGVRLGYALCENAALRKRMRAMLQPWNVSVIAQEAGIAALDEKEPGEKIAPYDTDRTDGDRETIKYIKN